LKGQKKTFGKNSNFLSPKMMGNILFDVTRTIMIISSWTERSWQGDSKL